MKPNSRIFIAGARGLVGSSIIRLLKQEGYENLLTPNSGELNLLDHQQVAEFFVTEQPEYVFLAAAKVGGIMSNARYPADFIYNNLMIQCNVIDAAHFFGSKKLLFLGSSCIYPKDCPQPIREEYLMTGPLEETNKAYAVAKIAGLAMCEAYNKQHDGRQYDSCKFICAMPTNLYGPGDNFNLEDSHLLPALIRKFHDAKEAGDKPVTLWGSGRPRRELLHVDDLASACLLLMREYWEGPINVGTGIDKPVKEIAHIVQNAVGHQGNIIWDATKPDGTMRKCLNVEKIKTLGWNPEIRLLDGIQKTYGWWLEHHSTARK